MDNLGTRLVEIRTYHVSISNAEMAIWWKNDFDTLVPMSAEQPDLPGPATTRTLT